jgi:hypothetical protein
VSTAMPGRMSRIVPSRFTGRGELPLEIVYSG